MTIIEMNKENAKVLNMFSGMLGNYLESKCDGQNVPLVIEKVTNNVNLPGDLVLNSDNLENVLQNPDLWSEMEEILQEFGLSSEVIQEIQDQSPELLKNAVYIVEYVDSQFRVLQNSVLVIQKQMHMDKISEYKSIYKQIDKKKGENNVEKDEWTRNIDDLSEALEKLAGEIKVQIEVCNKAPKSINPKALLKFLMDRQVNSKQLRESLQILEEDLSLYEEGIRLMSEVELYYTNRINSSKKTLRDAINFLTECFKDEKENMMYILTGDEATWVANPRDYCVKLRGILQELNT